jgi:hypothetical protein
VGHVPVGQLTGTGTFRCAKDGAVYTGEYEGNRFHGIGELTWADGDVYRGHFKGGLKEGGGMYTYASGDVYRGQWKENKMEGDGVYKWANGDVYRGQWKGGEKEGDGVFRWADGDVYRGQFKGGKKEGDGVFMFTDGRRTFDKCKGGEEVSSVPFDAANAAHAAVLRAANKAEARRVQRAASASGRNRPTLCVLQAQANAADARAKAVVLRVVSHALSLSGGVLTRVGGLASAGECG